MGVCMGGGCGYNETNKIPKHCGQYDINQWIVEAN